MYPLFPKFSSHLTENTLHFTKNNGVGLLGDSVAADYENETQQKHIVQRVAKFRDIARQSSRNAYSYHCLNGPRGLSYFARDQLSRSDCRSRKHYLSAETEVRHHTPVTATPRSKHERDTVYSSLRHDWSHVTTGCPTPRNPQNMKSQDTASYLLLQREAT
jgi:hypothetical protein